MKSPKKVAGKNSLLKLLYGTILLIITNLLPYYVTAQPGDLLSLKGKEAFNKQNYSVCIAELSKLIAAKPTNADAYAERARCNYLMLANKIENLKEAKKSFTQQEIDKEQASLSLMIKNIYKDANQAIKINAANYTAYNVRGLTKYQEDKTEEAITDFNKCIALQPGTIKAYLNKAMVLEKKKDFLNAINNYSRILEIDSSFIMANALRANAHKLNWEKENASSKNSRYKYYVEMAKDYNKAVSAEVSLEKLYTGMGELCEIEAGKNSENCSGIFATFKKVFPNNAYAHFKYASMIATKGIGSDKKDIWDLATLEFQKAIELDPENVEYYAALGNHYQNKIQDYDKALEIANQLIKKIPEEATGYAMAGNAYLSKKNTAKAIESFNKAIDIIPSFVFAYVQRAKAFNLKGDMLISFLDFSQAIALAGNTNGDLFVERGKFFLDRWKTEDAMADFNKAIELKTNDKCVYAYRALAFTRIAVTKNEDWNTGANYRAGRADMEKCFFCNKKEFYQGQVTSAAGYNAGQNYQKALQDYNEAGLDNTEVLQAIEKDNELATKNYKEWINKKQEAAKNDLKSSASYNESNSPRMRDPNREAMAMAAYEKAADLYNKSIESRNASVKKIESYGEYYFLAQKAMINLKSSLTNAENAMRKLWREHGDYLPQDILKQCLDAIDYCYAVYTNTGVHYHTYFDTYGRY